MRRGASTAAIFLAALAVGNAHAIDVQRADTHYHDGRYELVLEAILAAPPAAVERVLRDYASYSTLDDRVLETKVLEHTASNQVLLYSRLRACFAVFCRSVERVERVAELDRELIATSIPERSDVKFGVTHTQLLEREPGSTQIFYRTQIESKFWVPPIIGRRVMLNTLRDATIDLLTQVERTAQQPASAQ
jgi:hypothetical protein